MSGFTADSMPRYEKQFPSAIDVLRLFLAPSRENFSEARFREFLLLCKF